LLDQVFLNVNAGDFDLQPELTNGCVSSAICRSITPSGILGNPQVPGWRFDNAASRNTGPESGDAVDLLNLPANDNLEQSRAEVFALWSLNAPISAVPAPTTLPLIALGWGAALLARRKRV
jgi:hypothetical protein